MTARRLSPELLVSAYSQGIFPMARGRHGVIEWFSPDPRAILPLDSFHAPRSLARRVRSGRFEITFDHAFKQVIEACALPRPRQKQTWINNQIIEAYTELHRMGIGHSVEAWVCTDNPAEERILVGGLYGLAIGGTFFGESMFTRATDASKVCLVHLVEHLRRRGFMLLDTQIINDHMTQFGVVEIPRSEYLDKLNHALSLNITW